MHLYKIGYTFTTAGWEKRNRQQDVDVLEKESEILPTHVLADSFSKAVEKAKNFETVHFELSGIEHSASNVVVK